MAIAAFLIHLIMLKAGANFLIPFGFTSVVWPTAGVMLGLYFLFGRPVIVGTFISSLLVMKLDEQYAALAPHFIVILALLTILQMVFSKFLVERSFSFPIKINKPKETVRFLILTGPVSALVFSVLFTITLGLSLDIELFTLLYIGTAKWVGDLVSIVFLTPIFLFLYKNKYVRKAKKIAPAVLTSLFCISIVSFVFYLVSSSDYKDKHQQFVMVTQPFIEQFKISQTQIKHHLKALDGLFQASNVVNKEEFQQFVSKIKNRDTNLRALAWLPYVPGSRRKQFEQELKNEALASTEITKWTDTGLELAPNQGFYLPIKYIEPYIENRAVVGLDVSSHPIVSQSVMKAVGSKTFVLSPLFSLAQQRDRLTGMIVYYPIYTRNANSEDDFRGVVEAVFEIDILLDAVYQQFGQGKFTFEIAYGVNNLYAQEGHNSKSLMSNSLEMFFFDKNTTLSFSSTEEFESALVNWWHLTIMLFGCLIGVICVMFVFFIVTFNSNLSRKVTEKTIELLTKNDELESANQAKNLFLANISHEYRTPLNAIMGFTEIAKRESKDAVAIDYLSKIDNASNILLNIVNDVLDLSKMQAGEFNLETIPFQPKEVTLSVIEMLNSKAKEKSILLSSEFADSFSLWVEGDELRFKQIIINLISNAIKFTAIGGVKVWGECIDQQDGYRCLVIKVIDTGIGIKQQDQDKLFTSFVQAESSTTRKYGGTGLGLSIVKQLCELMDGDIQLTSEVNQGSQFTVRLKLAKAEPVEKSISTNQVETVLDVEANPDRFEQVNVLVVEDNKVNQMIVQKQLSSLGAKCHLASDGVEALDYLAHQMPDIILMDIQMPVMDGFTASEKIKHNPALADIPIVILSASVGKEDKDKAASLGIVDFINKPFQQADLLAVLSKYVK